MSNKTKKVALTVSFIISLFFNSISNSIGMTQYYYQRDQINASRTGSHHTSFLLIDKNRLMALPSSINDLISQAGCNLYYLDDTKNQDIIFKASSDSTAIDYDPYGQSDRLGQDQAFNFAYDSEYQDPSTLLIYLRARDYNPASQRFMTMDQYPLFNRYHFTQQDPINQLDPSGHQSVAQWWSKRSSLEKGLITTGAVIVGGGILYGIWRYFNPVMPVSWNEIIDHNNMRFKRISPTATVSSSVIYYDSRLRVNITLFPRDLDEAGRAVLNPNRASAILNKVNRDPGFSHVAKLKSSERVLVSRHIGGDWVTEYADVDAFLDDKEFIIFNELEHTVLMRERNSAQIWLLNASGFSWLDHASDYTAVDRQVSRFYRQERKRLSTTLEYTVGGVL